MVQHVAVPGSQKIGTARKIESKREIRSVRWEMGAEKKVLSPASMRFSPSQFALSPLFRSLEKASPSSAVQQCCIQRVKCVQQPCWMMLIQFFFSSQLWTAKFKLIYSFGPLDCSTLHDQIVINNVWEWCWRCLAEACPALHKVCQLEDFFVSTCQFQWPISLLRRKIWQILLTSSLNAAVQSQQGQQ